MTSGNRRFSRRDWLKQFLAGTAALHAAPLLRGQSVPTSPTGPTRPNIVLISVDTLRADHITHLGYNRATTPAIDRMAAEGTSFTHAFSVASWTGSSHASLLSGLYPPVHQMDDEKKKVPENFPTLARAFKAMGYRTHAIISGPMVEKRLRFDQGFDVFDETTYKTFVDFPSLRPKVNFPGITDQAAHEEILLYKTQTAHAVSRAAQEFIASAGPEPWFLFLHFWDVHADYIPPAEYDVFDLEYRGKIDGNIKSPMVNENMSSRDLQRLIAMYDGEIYWTDHQIGLFMERLRELDKRDNTCVVLCSDHGEEFFEYGNKGHGHNLSNVLIHVPLIFWWPGKVAAKARLNTAVSLVDVFPTLMDLTGGATQASQPATGPSTASTAGRPKVQGQSLAPVLLNPAQARSFKRGPIYGDLFFRQRTLLYKIEYPLKLIGDTTSNELFLYDLTRDPFERENLAGQLPDVAQAHAQDLKRWVAECEQLRLQLPSTRPTTSATQPSAGG